MLQSTEIGRSLGSIFDDMREGMQILDPELRYVYVNQTAATHARFPREALIGRRMTDLFPGIENTTMYSALETCLRERAATSLFNEFTYPDGRTAWFDHRVSPVPMGLLVLSIDVTSQREAKEELRRSRESLAATLVCMADAVITADVDGNVSGMNPAAGRLTGWKEGEAAGRPLREVVRLEDGPPDVSLAMRAGTRREAVLVTRDGGRTEVTGSGSPLRDATGDARGTVLVLRDVSEESRLNEMLHRSQQMEALGRLAAGIAHDFNNLLTVVMGCSDNLLSALSPSDPLRPRVEQIRGAGDRAAALTRQLFAIGRRQVLAPTVLDLNEVVRQEEGILARVIGEDVTLSIRLEPSPWNVRADPALLGQVIMNLAVNARDAMPVGGTLTLRTVNVQLDDEYERAHVDVPAGRYVMLAVSDTGIGMDAATRARIFEPFFTTKEDGKGTGLGLATVFGIVRQSDGHIWVYSEPGHGTTFKIYLPAVEEPTEHGTVATPRSRGEGKETILLVEDDDDVREITADSLRLYGYTVIEAASGSDAVRLCREHGSRIDLLISDVIMPDMGGNAVAEAVSGLLPGVRVLFVSGYTEDDVARHGIDLAHVAFLQKPFTAGTLARKVQEVLELGGQGRSV